MEQVLQECATVVTGITTAVLSTSDLMATFQVLFTTIATTDAAL